MDRPELVFVTGPNAVGKSSFIRSRLAQLETFDILMTDVFKGRIFELFNESLKQGRDIVLETVFNDSKYVGLVEQAKKAGYHTRLVQLFLESPDKSLERANFRKIFENGLAISKDTVLINFNENFRNVANYFFYFDRADFIYNGGFNGANGIIRFEGIELMNYESNDFNFIKMFAEYAHRNDRLDKGAYDIICKNQSYSKRPDILPLDGGRRFQV